MRRNTAANLAGRLLTAALAFVAIPILFSRLGAEAYGLVGLAVTLEALFALLDLGLSTVVNREVARNVGAGRRPEENRDLLRTLEAIYWPIGLFILILMLSASGWIADKGLNTSELSVRAVAFSLAVLAFTLAIRWPMSLYAGVLRGLQAQLLYNVLLVLGTTVRVLGGLAVVALISPTVQAFFLVDFVGSILQLGLMATAAWRSLPSSPRRPTFRFAIIRSVWRFAMAFNGSVILAQLLAQSGMLFVAKLLPLEDTGYYAIAASLAGVAVYIPYALVDASFPKLTGELERAEFESFRETYQTGISIATIAASAVALPIAFFARDILYAWTQSASIADSASGAAALLAVGNLIYSLWAIPYSALIAAGRVRLPLIVHLIVVPLALSATPYAISAAGTAGAAGIWVVASAAFLLTFPVAVERSIVATGVATTWTRPAVALLCGLGVNAGLSLVTKGLSSGVRLLLAFSVDLLITGFAVAWLRPAFLVGLVRLVRPTKVDL